MLALGDILAVALAAVFVGLWGSGPAAALLLVLSAPIWIVTAKLAGLYDRDHRTLRHLTVDELPWLMVWTLSSTALLTLLLAPFPTLDPSSNDRLLVWGAVLGLGFVFRAALRGLWRRITPPQRVLIVGEGPLAQAVVRKLELFPDIHARINGRVPSCAQLQGRIQELVVGVDRVVIACSELNEELLEQLLPVCRASRIRLTIVPPTRGMFGTATHLTHIADLPLLDYNTWDISRTTLALKRVFDVAAALMSIVGPRPEQLDLVERYAPEHQFRLHVKPGITGPMQVYGRGELTFDERLAVEREYVENLSLARDLRIVLMTLPAVFGRHGAF